MCQRLPGKATKDNEIICAALSGLKDNAAPKLAIGYVYKKANGLTAVGRIKAKKQLGDRRWVINCATDTDTLSCSVFNRDGGGKCDALKEVGRDGDRTLAFFHCDGCKAVDK